MQFKVVIPARYESSRLPGKPLLDIVGKPMVVHVIEKALASGAQQVVVATDDSRIKEAVEVAGYQALMTSNAHESGTDRIAEVVQKMAWQDDDIVVNVQGDEPLIDPLVIKQVASTLSDSKDSVAASACFQLQSKEAFLNPNVVKVVLDDAQKALYFSRAPIPFARDEINTEDNTISWQAYQHIGLYAYRAGFLSQYSQLSMVAIERVERLEQLRILVNGYSIGMHIVDAKPEPGVDTKEDLALVRQRMLEAGL